MSNFTQFDPGTILEIRQIHNKKEAINNKIYWGRDSEGIIHRYRGTTDGRLKEETNLLNDEDNIRDNSENIEDNKDNISSNEERITNLEKTKADKCQALAWSIIF